MGMLIDTDAIRWRVSRGDSVFSQRILLTALIKGDDQTRNRILRELTREHFGQHLLGLVYEWVVRELRSSGQVCFTELYQQVESYVVSRVLPKDLAFVGEVVAIALPNADAVDKAIMWLQKRRAGQVDFASHAEELQFSQRVILAALMKCGDETQSRILDALGESHFEDLTLARMFEWIKDSLKTEGRVDESSLYHRMEDYVTRQVLPGYMATIDHILAIEAPDIKTIDQAIVWLQKRYA
jgi:hypothetical protein